MSEWETIRDSYTHIAPVKFTKLRNHSADCINGFSDVAYFTSSKTLKPLQKKAKKPRRSSLSKMFFLLLVITLFTITTTMYWQCSDSTQVSTINWIFKDTTHFSNVSFTRLTQPLLTKLISSYQWTILQSDNSSSMRDKIYTVIWDSTTKAFNKQKVYMMNIIYHQPTRSINNKFTVLKETVTTSMKKINTAIQSKTDDTLKSILKCQDTIINQVSFYWICLVYEFELYIQSGKPPVTTTAKDHVPTINSEQYTARRIVQEVGCRSDHRKEGMKQDEAREKAEEIIKNRIIFF